MINVLVLCFVMTTLVTAGVFSPIPERGHKDDTTVDKEEHRVVVVEFDKDGGNTKVSISTQDQKGQKFSDKLMEGTKEKFEREGMHHSHMGSAKELVCDAFDKCKHKIDRAIGRTKEAVSEKAREVVDKADEEAYEAKERVKDAASKVKEKAHEVTGGEKRGGESVMETAKIIKGEADEEAHEVKERVKDVGSEKVKEKAHEVKGGVRRGGEIVMDTAKIIKGEAERDVSRKIEATIEKAKEAKEMVEEKVKEEGKKGLKKFMFDVLAHSLWLNSMGNLHLLGFATAYGMCVWVTFVSSYVLACALARQQFATVQSKIYPVYFKAMAYSVGLALVGYLMSRERKMEGIVMLQGLNLLAPLLMITVNMLYLEPQATEVMFERMKKEKEDGRAKEGFNARPSSTVVDSVPDSAIRGTNGEKSTTPPDPGQERLKEAAALRSQIIVLSEKLKRLNSYSSFLNVVTLMFLTSHLVHLGHLLNTVC